jgi:hypothetical protein
MCQLMQRFKVNNFVDRKISVVLSAANYSIHTTICTYAKAHLLVRI